MLDSTQLSHLVQKVSTPCWVYDASVIRAQIQLLRSFDAIRYAQKACSNIHILRLMRGEGVWVDAVSLGEIERATTAGYSTTNSAHPSLSPVVFTADVMDQATLERVVAQHIPVNCGSPDMLRQLGAVRPNHPVWLRINPGFGHGHSRKTNTGGEHSKHGIWHEYLDESIAIIKQYSLQLVGLHMHIGSGVDYAHLHRVCQAMVKQVSYVQKAGLSIAAISVGGGLSIPYQPTDSKVDTQHYYEAWHTARLEMEQIVGHSLHMEIEPGRFLVAESGILIAQLRAQKYVGKRRFMLVDAGFNDLMRPAMYGSFHPISVYSPEGLPRGGPLEETVVAGPLCESGDVFTQNATGEVVTQLLPSAQIGDLIVFHHTGAYGASMSSNYNTRPLLPEVLIDKNNMTLIRRRQKIEELIGLEGDCTLIL